MQEEKWSPLVKATLPPFSSDDIKSHARHLVATGEETCIEKAREKIIEVFDDIRKNDRVWMNTIYQVNARTLPATEVTPEMIHLSIKRRDKSPCRDWRHFQYIKNQLVGENCEAIEIYPAEDRLIDTANQYHLWCFIDADYRLPFGFNDGRTVSGTAPKGAVQREIQNG